MFFLLVLHLVVGIGIIAGGRALGRQAFLVAAIAPLATVVWAAVKASEVVDGRPVTESFAWVEQLGITIDLRLDAFALVMVALVSGIGLLICVYSLGYFSHDQPGLARLAGMLTLFAGSMLGVVLSDQLIALFVFWELTSITSFLLIGNGDTNARARAAAMPGDDGRADHHRPDRRHLSDLGVAARPTERRSGQRRSRAGADRCVHEVRAGAVQ